MCASYDPSGAIIVCGGGERFWRPNANCWQLVAGLTTQWKEIPQMYPVHGAATAFFQGKFWVLGGSTGDDNYDHTITDKVQAYNPRTEQWSVEEPLTGKRHKACAVAIDDRLVITGGTMLGLGKVKPAWNSEIGTRTAQQFDGTSWSSLPAMNRAKVEHGCTVASIGGIRGVVVVGGATGDYMVEFLDWEEKNEWRILDRLNRGRGMMPGIHILFLKKLYDGCTNETFLIIGVAFIGGKLSVIGGYSWPGGVDLIEEWDDDEGVWKKKVDFKLKYARFNHATVTVPGSMFNQCINPDL